MKKNAKDVKDALCISLVIVDQESSSYVRYRHRQKKLRVTWKRKFASTDAFGKESHPDNRHGTSYAVVKKQGSANQEDEQFGDRDSRCLR